MRVILTLIILIAIDFYAFQALKVVTQQASSSLRNIVTILFWGLSLIAFLYIIGSFLGYFREWSKLFNSTFRSMVFILYLSKILIIIPLLIDDLRRMITWGYHSLSGGEQELDLGRSKFLSRMGLLVGSIPLITLTYGMIRNPYRYKVFKEKVKLKNLPEAFQGLKIVQISDIHSGSFTFKEPVKRAIELINQQRADVVFFTGDLVNGLAEEMENFMDVFDKIESKYGVFSVLGNHDYAMYHNGTNRVVQQENMEKMKTTHQNLGWDLLINEHRLLDINGEKLAIIGVENYSTSPRFPTFGDLPKAHQGTESAKVKLLLSHDPSHWEDQVVPDFKDIDITFSGHTHGMQFGVEIPGWVKWSPIKYLYKQWAGLYQLEDQYLYVNRGLGFIGYPGRVGILPEVTLIELEKAV